jgi:biopolymer transport protein ExbB
LHQFVETNIVKQYLENKDMSILLSVQAIGEAAQQMPVLTTNVATDVASAPAELNVIDLFFKGGWIMGVLLLLSLIAGYVFIQRLLVVRRAGKEDESFMNRIKDYIHEGKIESAINLCRRNHTPSARMIEKGISRLGRPMHDVQIAIENVGNLEVAKLEKGLPMIATVAAGAPMIGFLGTVTGMVRAFFDMANAGTNVDVTLLSSGIYEALVTTVGGLVVGIIALFAYNYLVTQVDNAVNKMEARTMEFMDLLNEPANK